MGCTERGKEYLVRIDEFELVASISSRLLNDVIHHGLHLLWQRQAVAPHTITPKREIKHKARKTAVSEAVTSSSNPVTVSQSTQLPTLASASQIFGEWNSGMAAASTHVLAVECRGWGNSGGDGASLVQELIVELLAFLNEVILIHELLQRVAIRVEQRVDG